MLKLNDVLNFTEEELKIVKVRLSKHTKNDCFHLAIHDYCVNPELVNTSWLFHKGEKKNEFKLGQIAIHLINVQGDKWLLTTIKKITKINNDSDVAYEGVELEKYKNFFGRTYVTYHKSSFAYNFKWSSIGDKLTNVVIEENVFSQLPFPGFNRVSLSFYELKNIVDTHQINWCTPLGSVQAVYLLTDKKENKFYVGSATSHENYLLSRWKDYLNNGHGGNVKLKQLIEEKGFDYFKDNFNFKILKIFDENTPRKVILDDEYFFMNVFRSKINGYN